MQSELSWLVLVLAFAATAAGCVFLLARLWRMASPGRALRRPGNRPSQ
jgi:hypothetical protein